MNPQLELLLKIQSIETKIADFENEKKKLPIRKQISEIINDVNSMQDMYSRTEGVVTKIEQNCEDIKKSYEQYIEKYNTAQKRYEALGDDAPMEELEAILSGITSVRQSAEKKNAELSKMKQQLEKASKMATEIGKTINQRKQSYDKLKPEYDRLVSEIDVKINEEKASVKEIEKDVDEALMRRYKTAKSKLNRPPLFELTGNSCKGCNMSISNIVKKRVSTEIFVECENCGGLLYIAD